MHALPLPALVGLDVAQQALLLLAVEPRLRGIAVGASAGAGKSSLARGMRDLLATGERPSQRPFVELPLGVDEAGLLGGLDIEATLRAGRRVARAGALARADGGILYADQVNLLPDAIINPLIAALDTGEVRLEREGLSVQAAARFTFIGSYDPAEGLPRRHLLDRIGLLLVLPRVMDEQARAEVVRRNMRHAPAQVVGRADQYADELDLLRGLVQAAREQLLHVRIDDSQMEQLVAMAAICGVEGHRADLFAVYAACAAAALALRDQVEQEDLELAARLVILPRATRLPPPPDAPPPDEPPPPPSESDDSSDTPPDPPADDELSIPPEQVLSALAAELPVELEQLPFRALRRGKTGSRGTVAGKRGRHIRSIPGDPRRGRIDVSATLRAAAPFQPMRQEDRSRAGAHGEAARVRLRSDDLRIKQYRSKAGALFLFAVDASGSMALHRMRQAKGAVQALLQKAYVHRDRVALLAFRGQGAELLLPPSQSVELARRALDLLPTGGGTPLAAALLAAIDVAHQARSRGIMQTVLVLLTDGRANVGLRAGREGVAEELQTIGRAVAAAGIQAIVVDTQRSYLSRGEARKLAEWLAGQYVYLPNARGEQIAELAVNQVSRS